jgi:hypothetical protein
MVITVLSVIWSTRQAILKISEASQDAEAMRGTLQEVSLVFILASCYYAMALSNWATFQSDSDISNPRTGRASYWLQASAEWICLMMYTWALIAPKVFPDRFQ